MTPKRERGLARMSQDDLVRILDEAERQIADIRSELAARDQNEQQRAIEEMDFPEPLALVDWDVVWRFFQEVLEDLRTGNAK